MTVAFERFEEAAEAVRQLDVLLPAYEEVYVEPPYCEGPRDVAEFIDRYRRQTARAGFRLVLARERDQIIGFSYGYWLSTDTGWWRTVREPLPEEFVQETGARTYAVIELAVRRPWRRRGIAAEMHRRLLEERDAERITLSQRPEPEAAPAHTAYSSWGYRKVGRSRPWDGAPLYDVLVLPLK